MPTMQIRLNPPTWNAGPGQSDRIATGHQVTPFHPGILTKYIAAFATYGSGLPLINVVVDQDAYDPLIIDVPRRDGDRLTVKKLRLAKIQPDVPVGCQPSADVEEIRQNLDRLPDDTPIPRDRLLEAFLPPTADQPGRADRAEPATLAGQMARVLTVLMTPWIPIQHQTTASRSLWVKHTFASRLLQSHGQSLVEALRDDAQNAAKFYNQAVRKFPEAGMSLMRIEPDRVEVPLWRLRWGRPRERVFVDLADTRPIFTNEAGDEIENRAELAPRALLMTAVMRSPAMSDLFIHGTGGWNYDRITEAWWQRWRGETLSPMALATADVFLDFDDVPHGPPEVLERAIWHAHHLPHNLDRQLNLTSALVHEKQKLLAYMNDDRDKQRRRAAFQRIHQINRELSDQHPKAIAQAQRAVERARVGVDNAAIAGKRDWPFLLYPPEKLETLRDRIAYASSQTTKRQ